MGIQTIRGIKISDEQLEIINRIPTGMGIYSYEDGVPSLIYVNDGYYEMMGLQRENRTDFLGVQIMNVVHPDDREQLMEIVDDAVNNVGHFRTSVRLQLHEHGDIHWIQIDGRRMDEEEHFNVFYLTFTNIDSILSVTNQLEKSQASLKAAITAGKQLCFEFDPYRKTAEGYADTNLFALPNYVEDYPESLIAKGVFHPDDVEKVRASAREMASGTNEYHCEVRILTNGKYRWYDCELTAYFDQTKKYNVAIVNITDISLQKDALQAYQNHLDTVLRLNEGSISTFRMNLSKNQCGMGASPFKNILQLQNSETVDGFFEDAMTMIEDEAERRLFHMNFQRENLLTLFEAGQKKVSVEHRYLLEKGRTEWIETVLDMVRNPNTADVEAVVYMQSINSQKISNLILEEALKREYEQVAMLYGNNYEYFLYDSKRGEFCDHHRDFWGEGIQAVCELADEKEKAHLMKKITLQRVIHKLNKYHSYEMTFQAKTEAARDIRRFQISFSYVDENLGLMMMTVRDITDSMLLQQLSFEASHDTLTGLYTKEKTFQMCEQALLKHPGKQFALCHFDIQRFRLYNSFFGEEAGDQLLQDLGDMFNELSQDYEYGVYGRIEADVFCLFCPYDVEMIQIHEKIIHDRLQTYRNDFLLEGVCGIYITDSQDKLPMEVRFSRATIAAKNSKKKHLSYLGYFDHTMEQAMFNEQQILADMKTALMEEQFAVYLQPKYDLKSGMPCGAEALVRWNHPTKGMLPPVQFIPLFERNGFILELDQYMWEHVCMLLHQWVEEGIDPAPISVNVSRVSMYSPKIVPFLRKLLKKYNIPAKLLQLELTESAYMDDPQEMKVRLMELQHCGFEILMDDFGSGYSSLNTLREIPVDYLKVDMKFLASVHDDVRSRVVLASVIRMACWLDLPVITEGVETQEQKEFLEGVGCDYAQGYLFAKPMPVDEYEDKILENQECIVRKTAQNLDLIAKMAMNASPELQQMCDMLPYPVAFVDYMGDEFSYLRGNTAFVRDFGVGKDIFEQAQLTTFHMTIEDYDRLVGIYGESSDSRGISSHIMIHWKDMDGRIKRYGVVCRYAGKTNYSSILIVSFFDITNWSNQ